MKFIALLFGFVALVSAEALETFKVPQERMLRVQKLVAACAQENKVDPGMITKFADGMLPRNEATNKYLYCVARKTALIEEDGHMIVDKIASYLGSHPLVGKFKEALRKCNEVTKEDPIATAVEMHSCYSKSAPIHFTL